MARGRVASGLLLVIVGLWLVSATLISNLPARFFNSGAKAGA